MKEEWGKEFQKEGISSKLKPILTFSPTGWLSLTSPPSGMMACLPRTYKILTLTHIKSYLSLCMPMPLLGCELLEGMDIDFIFLKFMVPNMQ